MDWIYLSRKLFENRGLGLSADNVVMFEQYLNLWI